MEQENVTNNEVEKIRPMSEILKDLAKEMFFIKRG